MTTARRYCFTIFINDDLLPELDHWDRKLRESLHYRGAAYQLERCPTTHREHIQGYIEFNAPRKFNSVLKDFPQGTHLETARGDRSRNLEYVTKADTRIEGPWVDDILKNTKGQGNRTDLADLGRQILEGNTDERSLALEHPELFMRYPQGISKLLQLATLDAKRTLRPQLRVEVVYGPAGSGKTRSALADLETSFLLDGSNSDTLWFDGYNGEPTLVLDDFYGWVRHGTLLRILDIYPYRCPIKGGHTYAAWTRVVITSNQHPSTWYEKFPWDQDKPLQRRIHHIWEVKKHLLGYQWTCEITHETKSFSLDFDPIN